MKMRNALAPFLDAVTDLEWLAQGNTYYRQGIGLQLPPSLLRPTRR